VSPLAGLAEGVVVGCRGVHARDHNTTRVQIRSFIERAMRTARPSEARLLAMC
jgi:hypothetical protein